MYIWSRLKFNPMKNTLSSLLCASLSTLICFSLILSSCKDEDPQVEKPFIAFNIPDNYMESSETVYLFLSDIDGNVLEVKPVTNGEQVKFSKPAGLGDNDTFVLNHYSRESTDEYVTSYTGFSGGTYDLKGFAKGPRIGSHEFTINHSDNTFGWESIGSDVVAVSTSVADGKVKLVTGLNRDNAHVVLFHDDHNGSAPRYKLIPDVKLGLKSEHDFTTFNDMNLVEVNTSPDAMYVFSAVIGLPFPDKHESYNQIWWHIDYTGLADPTKTKLYYAGTAFPEYVFLNIYSLGSIAYNFQHIGSTPETNLLPLEASATIEQDGSNLTVSSAGDADLCRVTANQSTEINGVNYWYGWAVEFPTGADRSIKLPTLPEEIAGQSEGSFSSLEFNYWIMRDYEDLNDYNAYLNFEFNQPDIKFKGYREKGEVVDSGGRLSSTSLKRHLEFMSLKHGFRF
jgi:hypothetical protein